MLFSILYFLLRVLLRIAPGEGSREREAEILVLCHQLAVLKRQNPRPKLRRRDRMMLAALARLIDRKRWEGFIVKPATILRWHRELVRRKWTFKHKKIGRPPLDPALVVLIIQIANQNPRWGAVRIKGELKGLGHVVGVTTIRMILPRPSVGPAPRRGPSWSEFLKAQADAILATDFFTVDSVFLKNLYVFFVIEVGSRCVKILGVTSNPDGAWVTQQARNMTMDGGLENLRFLIRDRDAKFTGPFDEVFGSQGMRVIKTPVRAPKANAYAERFVRTVRAELLDLVLVTGRRHLLRLLADYEAHYNSHRPHRGIDLEAPDGVRGEPQEAVPLDEVRRTKVVSGLISEYRRAA
ncbi:MAG: integrase core domain-containing protein [Actinomycetota bacterium]